MYYNAYISICVMYFYVGVRSQIKITLECKFEEGKVEDSCKSD